MAHTNKTLSQDIETVFLSTSTEYSFLSSSLVKAIAKFGGPVDHLVPQTVALDLYQCYAKTPIASAQTASALTAEDPTVTLGGPPIAHPLATRPEESISSES